MLYVLELWCDRPNYMYDTCTSYRMVYIWEYECYTSLIYTSTRSHAHCVHELPASHTIIRARTQELIVITTKGLPYNSKRSMTFTVARITEYFKNASYVDKKTLAWTLFLNKLYIESGLSKTVRQPFGR